MIREELSEFGLNRELTKKEWERLLIVTIGNNDDWEEIKKDLKLQI